MGKKNAPVFQLVHFNSGAFCLNYFFAREGRFFEVLFLGAGSSSHE
jgi:hypothetical protein